MRYFFESYEDFINHKAINEIGEATSLTYDWDWDSFSKASYQKRKELTANFDAMAGKYEVTLKPTKTTDVYRVDFGIKRGYGEVDYEIETNRGEMFKILATVVKISREGIQMLGAKGLIVVPIKSNENDNRRLKLYMAYIKKQLPEAKVNIEKITDRILGKSNTEEVIKIDL